ncbi:MAG: Xaa-Pro peptidase family protein, partial [Candidatus Aminicenantes bacterium]|nr:Xaa-Pro peptidase family protein [Candidatus Aminicenantes bacterium]
MNKRLMCFVWVLLLTISVQALSAAPLLFDRKEYAARRSRLMDKIPDGIAVFLGAATPAGDREFRQGHDFAYFTGIEIPDAYLIIDGVRKESLLFFTIGEKEAEGEGLPPDLVRNPKETTGIEKVLPAEQFGTSLAGLGQRTRIFYTMFKPEELGAENTNEKFNALQKTMTLNPWDGRLTRELQFVRQLRDKFPQVDVRDCSALVWDLRKIKTPAELEVLRRAARIGVKAHNDLIQSTRPGVSEKALEAVFEFACRVEGAVDMAYMPILMSGKNHAFGHYHKYDRILKDGDFIILDAGPDYADYHIDISTTFPASGAFTPRQKELYEAALAVRNVCQANYRPGVTFRQVGAAVEAMLKEKKLDRFVQDFRGIIRYGGYNHMIGLATHDVTGTFAGPDEVLTPGFVFACDIQLFRLEEEIGIRIEDTIAVTETGYENLSLGVPRTVAEIEALKKTDGLLQIAGDARLKR